MNNSFDAKSCNNHREYHYYLPSYVLQAKEENINRKYRISPELFEKVQLLTKFYKGTKLYHNYTKKGKEGDAMRHIYCVNCFDKIEEEGVEFLKFVFVGQSFLYNQIRKMVGMVVKMCREGLPIEFMEKSFEQESVNIPLAPGEGLFLYKIDYSKYNKHKQQKKNDIVIPDEVKEEMEEFAKEIFKRIVKSEQEDNVFEKWLEIMEKYDDAFEENKE